jgi:hypothetical protein
MAEAYVTLISIQPAEAVRTAFRRGPFTAHPQGERQTFTTIYSKRRQSLVRGTSATGSEGAGV